DVDVAGPHEGDAVVEGDLVELLAALHDRVGVRSVERRGAVVVRADEVLRDVHLAGRDRVAERRGRDGRRIGAAVDRNRGRPGLRRHEHAAPGNRDRRGAVWVVQPRPLAAVPDREPVAAASGDGEYLTR